LEKFWDEKFSQTCVDEDCNIDEDFYIWKAGTFREDIWHWIDERHSKGVGYIMNERK